MSIFWSCEGSDGTTVSILEARELDNARVASVVACGYMWGPR